MKKKDFRHLSRSELVDIIHEMQDGENGSESSLPDAKAVEEERARLSYKARFRKTLISTISILIVVAAIAVLVSTFFFPVIQISGDSMEPTLHDEDIVMLCKNRSYSRGELCCISWQNKLLIKRIIGLPGDNIVIEADGSVYVNGELLDEPYVTDKSLGECDLVFPYQVPDGKIFVLGDHRNTSIDSRSSAIGCIDQDQIVGQVLFRIWPFGNK